MVSVGLIDPSVAKKPQNMHKEQKIVFPSVIRTWGCEKKNSEEKETKSRMTVLKKCTRLLRAFAFIQRKLFRWKSRKEGKMGEQKIIYL